MNGVGTDIMLFQNTVNQVLQRNERLVQMEKHLMDEGFRIVIDGEKRFARINDCFFEIAHRGVPLLVTTLYFNQNARNNSVRAQIISTDTIENPSFKMLKTVQEHVNFLNGVLKSNQSVGQVLALVNLLENNGLFAYVGNANKQDDGTHSLIFDLPYSNGPKRIAIEFAQGDKLYQTVQPVFGEGS